MSSPSEVTGEVVPSGFWDGEGACGAVLGVANRNDARGAGDFDAGGLSAAVAGLAPAGFLKIHFVSASVIVGCLVGQEVHRFEWSQRCLHQRSGRLVERGYVFWLIDEAR